ncbi:MAG: ABC transporter ATP-binding protein [Deltaproteobacteria bacterium]|nr:ABC transporter ATP-binding protein [Deltaproteobacteria bacterium]
MKTRPPHSERSTWRRLLHAFGPDLWSHRRRLTIAYLCRLIAVGAGVLAPWPLKIIIDHVITAHPLPPPLQTVASGLSPDTLVIALAVFFIVVTIVGALAGAREKAANARVRERLTLELRDRLLVHLQTLPPTLRTAHRSGELVLRLVGDVDLFVRAQTKTLPLLFQHAATTVAILMALLWLDPRLAALCLSLVLGIGLLVRYYSSSLGVASRTKRRHEGEVSGLAQEIIRGLPVLQALGQTQPTRKRFASMNVKRLQAGVQETWVTVRMERALQIAQGVVVGLVTGGGALLILRGDLTIGELTLVLSYLSQLLKPIEKLNDLTETTTRALVGGERLLALLDLRPAVEDAPTAIDLGRARGEIEFREVSFAYPVHDGRTKPVLRGVNMRLAPGQLTVLIGRSGAGKSTLLSLLVRLFDPSTGTILLDGHPLPTIALRSLRAQIATMTQEAHLFAGPLRAVLSASETVSDERKIWEALTFVALDDFVRGLPDQLDTMLGEDGLNLSGGQRQRLSLARAFLLDRPILLLDEPLANVDTASATVILEALARLRVGRTCLAITHQPALLEYADVVYRLEEGGMIEKETHAATVPVVRRRAS